ncbi:5-hydroxytryptamine receptor 1-like [Mya arenaria]|uniref:5-hydroxytryptamine receptor 1-like n=1 Tax=Mya arenaria TaxID=6604 RepID=UPI0022E6A304|nr:5-hydroxytryptamine receptor 1-like [Mya arenaria]
MNVSGHRVVTNEELLERLNGEMRHAVAPVTVFVGVEILLGFVGNLVVLGVFFFRYHHCNFRYFVLCLAVFDFISTLTTMPGEILTQQYWYKYPFPIVCKVKSFFNVFTVSGEALCLCTIAVERYRKVCAPFGWQIKHKYALLWIVVIFVVAFVLAFPVFFLWGATSHTKQYGGRYVTVTLCEKDARFSESNTPMAYVTTVEAIIAVCLVIMMCLYVFVAKKLIKLRKKAQYHCKSRSHSALNMNEAGMVNNLISLNNGDVPTVSNVRAPQITQTIDTYDETDGGESEFYDVESCQQDRVTSWNGIERSSRRKRREKAERVRTKTVIMFILTIVFMFTIIMYFTLLTMITRSEDILRTMTDSQKTVYFFFLRLVFINHVINPFVYGCLDPQFKRILKSWCCK